MKKASQIHGLGRIVDSRGQPMRNARLTFFKANTTEPVTVYSDPEMQNALASLPMVADDNGYLPAIFIDQPVRVEIIGRNGHSLGIIHHDPIELTMPSNLADAASLLAQQRGYDIGIVILAKRGDFVEPERISKSTSITDITFGVTSDLQLSELWTILREIEQRSGQKYSPVLQQEFADAKGQGLPEQGSVSGDARRGERPEHDRDSTERR